MGKPSAIAAVLEVTMVAVQYRQSRPSVEATQR